LVTASDGPSTIITVVEASRLHPFEIIELTASISVLKLLALAINVVVVVYLLIAAPTVSGSAAAATRAAEIHDQDVGWAPLERATPSLVPGEGHRDHRARRPPDAQRGGPCWGRHVVVHCIGRHRGRGELLGLQLGGRGLAVDDLLKAAPAEIAGRPWRP